MPKYLKKHKYHERKPHKVIQGIKHKYCWTCSPPQWKPLDQFGKMRNRKRPYCKACVKKYDKERRKALKEKLKQAREAALTGFLVCLNTWCTVKGMQPLDQFISPYVRNDEPTRYCKTCRDKQKELDKQRQAACQNVYEDWRKTHPCVICSQNPEHVHNPLLIEADHLSEFKKIKQCSDMKYWSAKCRGPAAQKAELRKCQALCRFHHALVTQQRNHDNGKILKQVSILRKRAVINAEKHKRGCCSNPKCNRVLKKGEECAFHFDHRDDSTKFMYRGKTMGPAEFVHLSDADFDTQWPLEKELVDLLCANCHVLKSRVNRDGYK